MNFAIGQGDTLVTPLQLARAYAALANGGTLYEPRIAKAIVSPSGEVVKRIKPKVQGHVKDPAHAIAYDTEALLGTAKFGTHGVEDDRLPARPDPHPLQDRARPRSTASSRPRGSRPTTRTTSC